VGIECRCSQPQLEWLTGTERVIFGVPKAGVLTKIVA